MGYVAAGPTCRLVVILSSALKHRESPRRWRYVANGPTCGPLLSLSPKLKHRRFPQWHGFCSPWAFLWAGFNFIGCTKALGIPHTARVT